MRAFVQLLCVLLACLLLISCAQPDDGVVIIPSAHGEGQGTVTEAIDTEASAAAEETAAAQTSVSPEAQRLLEDPEFLALLDGYGVDAADPCVPGILSAMLAIGALSGHAGNTAPGGTSGIALDGSKIPAELGGEPDDAAVFWTAGGSVWHVTSACSALAKSKSVQSGTEKEAMAAGKSRVCKRCGS